MLTLESKKEIVKAFKALKNNNTVCFIYTSFDDKNSYKTMINLFAYALDNNNSATPFILKQYKHKCILQQDGSCVENILDFDYSYNCYTHIYELLQQVKNLYCNCDYIKIEV